MKQLFLLSVAIAAISVPALARRSDAGAEAQGPEQACAAKDFQAAVQACSRIIADAGVAADLRLAAYKRRGAAYVALGKTDEAIEDYNAALSVAAQDAASRPDQKARIEAEIYLGRAQAYAYSPHRDPTKALADFDEAIRLAPDWPDTYLARGDSFFWRGEAQKAVADFERALKLNPRPSLEVGTGLYNHLGGAKVNLGDCEGAISEYTAGIDLGPNAPDAIANYDGRAMVYKLKGDFARSLSDYSSEIKLYADDSDTYSNRATVYRALHDDDHALADLDTAIRLDADNGLAHLARGEIYAGRKDYRRAIADFDEALRAGSASARLLLDRSRAYAALGDARRAEADNAGAQLQAAVTPAIAPMGAFPGCRGGGHAPGAAIRSGG